jgi:adenosylmethionine---8-amino-7-oxononanoate aminotransferase
MNTQTLRKWDVEHVWHPFTPMLEYGREETPIIVGGDGFDLIDSDGKRYLDGVSSLWCNIHGHRVPEIDQAVREQLDRVAHSTLLGLAGEPSIRLARQLVERTPEGLNRVFFSDAGATAVEAALKIACQYHRQKPQPEQRDLFVTVAEAYHGDTMGSVSLGPLDLFHSSVKSLLFEKLTVPTPTAFRLPEGHDAQSYLQFCYDELERTLRENADRIAAVVVEPLVQGAAGILVHPSGWLRRVRELTSELGILLIADEVAVGFGRTGTMFACEQENVCPDLMCVAKGLSGGYLPVAATLATDAVFNAFLDVPSAGKTFYHGHTFTGNALGCAAALASLELFDKNNLISNIAANAARLATRLSDFNERSSLAGDIRHKGLMAGIELVQDRSSNEPFAADRRIGHQVTLAARRRGVIIRPLGNVITMIPAPGMPGELVDRLCDVTFEAIDEVTHSASAPP